MKMRLFTFTFVSPVYQVLGNGYETKLVENILYNVVRVISDPTSGIASEAIHKSTLSAYYECI